MASVAGVQATANLAAYVAGKAGIIGLTRVAALDELRAAMERRAVTVVDALPAGPFSRRHLPGAVNLVTDEAANEAAKVLPDKGAAIVTYSTDDRCGRGEQLAARLRELGYTDVRVYSGGIEDGVGAGLPVTAPTAG